MKINKCEKCNCDCHCNLKEHSDLYGVCFCSGCKCDKSVIVNNNDEREVCQ